MGRTEKMEELKRRAQEDIAQGRQLAVRKLFILPAMDPVTVSLLGPYDVDFDEAVCFTEIKSPGANILLRSEGDRFQSISLGVELCRVHLDQLLKKFPEGLVESTGELYASYDLPENPVARPPVDFEHLVRRRDQSRTQG